MNHHPVDIEQIQNLLVGATLALPRMLVIMLLVPLFNTGGQMPRTLRTGIAIGLMLPVALGVAGGLEGRVAALPVAALVLKECVIGLAMGILLAAPFWTIESAGALLDQQRGENAGQAATPFSEGQASIMGSAMKQALVIWLAVTGGYQVFYELLLQSYQAWPVLAFTPEFGSAAREQVLAGYGEFSRLAIVYAAPFVMVLLVIDFGFAMLGVTAPNLQTYFAAMPVKSLAGMFVLIVYFHTLLGHGGAYFLRALDGVRGLF
jgi:type III secretion protein T